MLCGYAGREIGGRRVGLIAAFLVAVYPNLWMSDELGLSEALSPLLVALVLLTAYRFWKRPGLGRPSAWAQPSAWPRWAGTSSPCWPCSSWSR